jgi:hypothetical protein
MFVGMNTDPEDEDINQHGVTFLRTSAVPL